MDNRFKDSLLVEGMMNYINEKYGEEFQFEKMFGGFLGSDTHKCIVSSEKYPGKGITVRRIRVNCENDFSDNYMAVTYEDRTRELVEDVVHGCYGDDALIMYYLDSNAFPSKNTDWNSFEEYIADPSASIYFTAIINYQFEKADRDRVLKSLEEKLVSSGLCCGGKLYFCRNVDLTSLNSQNYYSDFLQYKTYDECLYFDMSTNQGITKSDWEDKPWIK